MEMELFFIAKPHRRPTHSTKLRTSQHWAEAQDGRVTLPLKKQILGVDTQGSTHAHLWDEITQEKVPPFNYSPGF
jgi:hypothetical protein